ncbi:hypothetical protein Bpfe_005137 [Biomphalaria pfeifferi]|uniref:Mutator-like transposase domain-containing protein n=1 Tax=Biomphalaria pfeifferi TaxID=112525 RepID=A0AAD8FJR7_BIOPF|nr:hypothetical protein Bpfe_005137 [Biomphalaria pfeifferi]
MESVWIQKFFPIYVRHVSIGKKEREQLNTSPGGYNTIAKLIMQVVLEQWKLQVQSTFLCAVETRNIRYTQYLGDGDSSSYKKVVDSKPYGEKPIEKLECVGQVQKRCGTRPRRLVNDNKGQKLDDGKGISGIGRLTSKKIDTPKLLWICYPSE